jgi:hypothetical protein
MRLKKVDNLTYPQITEELIKQLDHLPLELQKKVLEFAKALSVTTMPKGIAGRQLLKFAGIMDQDSAKEMNEAIKAGCERVDINEW